MDVSQVLRDAHRYEEIREKQIREEPRPEFHLSARVGWMNDPNGFSYYNGEYHLFYQYHPYDSHWGPMHWGHAVSTDLLHWKHLPAALGPDADYDRDGCFSGSAVTLDDGKQLIMYTGVVNETQSDQSVRGVQTQCIAVGNGMDYEKYAGNPVLDEKNLPEEGSRFDFRDPKMWRSQDGRFWCVVGSCTKKKDGRILLFGSEDGLRWKFEKILIRNNKRFGKMWECPDFFELDGRQVLLVSPQDMLPDELGYHAGNGTVCFIGDYDEKTATFIEDKNQCIDYGIDFYAPQTVLAPDGRRIMIGWMQNWDTCNFRSEDCSWFGQMSLPRELSIQNGRFYQKPIRELEAFRKNKVQYKNVRFSDFLELDGIEGRTVDLELKIHLEEMEQSCRKFTVRFAQNDRYYTSVNFWPKESVVNIDRTFSGSCRAILHQRKCLVESEAKELRLRIILDKFSAEVFVNDGAYVLTATFYTELSASKISFYADGEAEMDVIKYCI